MPEIKYAKAQTLYEALLTHTDESGAAEIACCIPLSKTPGDGKRLEWIEAVCSKMAAQYDDAAIRDIRAHCSCQPPAAKLSRVKKLYKAAGDDHAFCDLFNKEYAPDNTLEARGGSLYFYYPECYCSCIKNISAPIPRAWCYCSLGYVKRLFAHAFSNDVQVDLVESVKNGGERCTMKITRF